MRGAGAIVVNHSMGLIKSLCTKVIVLEDGELMWFDDIDEGIARHNPNMPSWPAPPPDHRSISRSASRA